MDELSVSQEDKIVTFEYTGHCPYFGQEVPSGFFGCSECPVARICYQVWELSERSENVQHRLRSTTPGT